MAETIANRVSRIIAGSTHALLDKAENLAPQALMAQSIREIEQVISDVRIELGKAEAAKHLVTTQITKLNEEYEKLTSQIQLSIQQSRDDLATVAIGRQADIEDYLPVLQKSLQEQSQHAHDSESQILALQAKKRELEQLLQEYLATSSSHSSSSQPQRESRIEDAEASFGRVFAQQTGVAGLQGNAAQDAAKLKELANLQREHRIAERLAALKIKQE